MMRRRMENGWGVDKRARRPSQPTPVPKSDDDRRAGNHRCDVVTSKQT
jgi:hypothetical protein